MVKRIRRDKRREKEGRITCGKEEKKRKQRREK